MSAISERLDPQVMQIRVLSILPANREDATPLAFESRVASLDDQAVFYNALSYRWGDQEDVRSILVNESILNVTANLACSSTPSTQDWRHCRNTHLDRCDLYQPI